MKGELIQGFSCPKCGKETIVYNGNYFCDRLGEGCTWALDDSKATWNRYGFKLYLQLMKQRGQKPNPKALPHKIDHLGGYK